jgi:hypothetical protein
LKEEAHAGSVRLRQSSEGPRPFTASAQTQVLLDFGKPGVPTLPDLSGKGHHGVIRGGDWFKP